MTSADEHTLSAEMARRATELLGDKQFHPHEDIVRELMKVVPPGVAYRRRERDRIVGWHQRHPEADPDYVPPNVRPISREKQIAAGARRIVYDFLASSVFETYPKVGTGQPNPNKMIRMAHPHRTLKTNWKSDRIAELEAELATVREANDNLIRANEALRRQVKEAQDAQQAGPNGPSDEGRMAGRPGPPGLHHRTRFRNR